MNYFPINLDINNRRCVVVGGGRVAERKVKSLLECNAKVIIISPDLTKGLSLLQSDNRVAWENRQYFKGDLEGAFLVIAATDDETTQAAVFKDAEEENLLVNVADVPERCNFILPATVKRNDLSVSVSTGGKSPALARLLREKLEKDISQDYGILADILGLLRPVVLSNGKSHDENKNIFNKILDKRFPDWINEGNLDQIFKHLKDVLGNDIDTECLNQIENMLK